jgi:hypothetical protein
MDMGVGELVLLNLNKTIMKSEMVHLRKIEGVLIQSRYVRIMWVTIILLALTRIIVVKGATHHTLSATPTKMGIEFSRYVSTLSRY